MPEAIYDNDDGSRIEERHLETDDGCHEDTTPEIGPLANTRHERFAQELAAGTTLEAAYEAAGYTPDRRNANRLRTTNDKIRQRIATLQRQRSHAADIDVGRLIEMHLDAIEIARRDRNPAAMTGAAREIAMLLGLRQDRRAVRHEVAPPEPTELNNVVRALAAVLTTAVDPTINATDCGAFDDGEGDRP